MRSPGKRALPRQPSFALLCLGGFLSPGMPGSGQEADGPCHRGETKILHSPCIDEAEAQVAVGVAGIVPVAVGAPEVPGVVVPAAAAVHAIGTAVLTRAPGFCP